MILQADKIFEKPIDRIEWYLSEIHSKPTALDHLTNIEYFVGLPETITNENRENLLVVIDDLYESAIKSDLIHYIFTKLSHHHNIFCILLGK